jgi:L-threonylcarbamoyladenylate synthase
MLNLKAVGRLYGVKKRSRGKPSTIHVANLRDIKRIGCRITKRALDLMRRFWPGPLTIILRSMDGGTIGFRMPANNVALRLISASGVPVIAPSANISGKSPPTSAREVLKDLDGKIDLILDAGRTKIGVESTIVDISSEDPVVLREGAVSTKALSKVLRFK